MQVWALLKLPSSAWAEAKNNKYVGMNHVAPVDRNGAIQDVMASIASEALPVGVGA